MTDMVTVPTITCGNGLHLEEPSREPVFHFVQPSGMHGIAGVATVKRWALAVHREGVPLYSYLSDLFILLPDRSELIPCILVTTVSQGDEGSMLEIRDLRPGFSRSAALYTCGI
jgi:hypothetical protein